MSGISREKRSRSRRAVRRGVGGLGAIAVTVVLATPAGAAQPNHRACLGEDIRTYAMAGPGFGGFVAWSAADGLGEEIQSHLAGDVGDAVIDNSCND